jgi:hypothetical protein
MGCGSGLGCGQNIPGAYDIAEGAHFEVEMRPAGSPCAAGGSDGLSLCNVESAARENGTQMGIQRLETSAVIDRSCCRTVAIGPCIDATPPSAA